MNINKAITRNEGFIRSLEKECIDVDNLSAPLKRFVDTYVITKKNGNKK